MLFMLVLGVLLGGSAAVLLGQWRSAALTVSPPRGRWVPLPTLPRQTAGPPGAAALVAAGRRRNAA